MIAAINKIPWSQKEILSSVVPLSLSMTTDGRKYPYLDFNFWHVGQFLNCFQTKLWHLVHQQEKLNTKSLSVNFNKIGLQQYIPGHSINKDNFAERVSNKKYCLELHLFQGNQ